MLALVNAHRAEAGATPLVWCPRLVVAAQRHSQDQAAANRMSHVGSDGSSLPDRVLAAGYTGWTGLGENVAAGQPTVESVVSAWMASPRHRANLLAAGFAHVGFGRANSATGTPYWTQNFGRSGTC